MTHLLLLRPAYELSSGRSGKGRMRTHHEDELRRGWVRVAVQLVVQVDRLGRARRARRHWREASLDERRRAENGLDRRDVCHVGSGARGGQSWSSRCSLKAATGPECDRPCSPTSKLGWAGHTSFAICIPCTLSSPYDVTLPATSPPDQSLCPARAPTRPTLPPFASSTSLVPAR